MILSQSEWEAKVARYGYPPFAPAAVVGPKLAAPSVRKATGHIFADCPAIDAPLPKTKQKGCAPCNAVWSQMGEHSRRMQQEYDAQWFAQQEGIAAAPSITPPPLPEVVTAPPTQGETTMTTTTNVSTATDRQMALLKTLFAERKGNAEAMSIRTVALALYKDGNLTKGKASEVIDAVMKLPKDRKEGGYAPLPDVPAGHYAIASKGDNDLMFVRIDRPTEGRFAGRTYGKLIIGGQPESPLPFPQLKDVLARIVAAGIDASATLYGQEIGRCWRCNRTLTDESSRRAGIGPECAKAA